MAGLDVIFDVRRRLRPGFVVGPHAAVGGETERGLFAETLADELLRRRMDREMADQPGPQEQIHLLQQRGAAEPVGGGLGLTGWLALLAQRAHEVPVPGPAEVGHAEQHAAGAVIEDPVPDRGEQEVVPELRLDPGQGELDQLGPLPLQIGGGGRVGKLPRPPVSVLPVLQGLPDQVVGVLDRPGVSGQAPDQPGPRHGGEPPQPVEPAHEAEQGVGRQQRDRDEGATEVIVTITATRNDVERVRIAREPVQRRPEGRQGRRAPPPERGRIGGAINVVARADQEGFEVVEIDDQALDVPQERAEEAFKPLRRIVAREPVHLPDDLIPAGAEPFAAILQELADEGLGDPAGMLLGVLAPQGAEVVAGVEQTADHVQGERGLAQPAEALEHEHALARAAGGAGGAARCGGR